MGSREYLAGLRYDRLPDDCVVRMAQLGDTRACEHLLYKYLGLVRSKTRSYFIAGADSDDLLQIGMIGLWHSIMSYSADRDISFISFARICIERHVVSAIKSATRQKHSPLNNSISLDYYGEDTDCDFDLTDVLMPEQDLDPEEVLLLKERRERLRTVFRNLLSCFEWEVLRRYRVGKSYREIARELACSTKSVDNALGRIRRKVADSPNVLVA